MTRIVVGQAANAGLVWLALQFRNQPQRLLATTHRPVRLRSHHHRRVSVLLVPLFGIIGETGLSLLSLGFLIWSVTVAGFILSRALTRAFQRGCHHRHGYDGAQRGIEPDRNPGVRVTRHIYFLGIGGTLMGSLAQLAREKGMRVSGSDKALYPPMSDQLAAADIEVHEGFDPAQLEPPPDLVVIGNAGLPRGHPAVEYVLESGIPYTSGAEFLGREISRRPLGTGGVRHPRQDHYRQYAGLDSR